MPLRLQIAYGLIVLMVAAAVTLIIIFRSKQKAKRDKYGGYPSHLIPQIRS